MSSDRDAWDFLLSPLTREQRIKAYYLTLAGPCPGPNRATIAAILAHRLSEIEDAEDEWERRQRLGEAVDELNGAMARYNCNIANGLQSRNGPVGRLIAALEDEIAGLRKSLGNQP